MRDQIAALRGTLFRWRCRLFFPRVEIGRGLLIYKRLIINGRGNVRIGHDCVVDGIKGDNSQFVTIDTHSQNASIYIGNGVVLAAARISSRHAIEIGNNVLIEESSIVDTDFHTIDRSRSDDVNENTEMCKIVIADNVTIGARSFVLKGVKMGRESTLLPGSIAIQNIKEGVVAMGNPAREYKR